MASAGSDRGRSGGDSAVGGGGSRGDIAAGGGSRGGSASGRIRGGSKAGQGGGESRFEKHEGKANPQYWLPRAEGGRFLVENEYREHPFLVERNWKEKRPDELLGKICLSFGLPADVRNNRWKEDDRDTNNGRCKYNHDCRLGDGPAHTDPKPQRMRDRLDSQGKLVLKPKPENVPVHAIHPGRYKVMDKHLHAHHYKAPMPPFKGAGGARVCWGRDDALVEVNLGHGHGVFPHQQFRGPEGKLPFGQYNRQTPLTDARRLLIRKAWSRIAGGQEHARRGVLLRRLNVKRIHNVVSRQCSEQEAQDQLLQEMIGSSDALDGPEEVTYEAFEGYWERRSWLINDDAYFALVLHNHFPLD